MREEVERRTHASGGPARRARRAGALKERLEAENVYLQEEIRTQHNFNEIIGNSPALLEALRKVERVAPTEATVLIVGETGSGKELFARAIHSRSRRSGRPLVKVNCGAIAPGLVESELFGHVKGAFTGAIEARRALRGRHGGTIFLDEIGELPPEAQVKLLRVLQEQEFEPVGSSRTVRVSVRVIAATNRNLDRPCARARSAPTCCTASTCSPSRCRRCASADRTSSCSPPSSSPASRGDSASPFRASAFGRCSA
jgi:transcriptional regulator with GAF, ATPase, and Fis domain